MSSVQEKTPGVDGMLALHNFCSGGGYQNNGIAINSDSVILGLLETINCQLHLIEKLQARVEYLENKIIGGYVGE